ncbi:MAG: hypothetical protein DSY43_05325 [Gammaproteobacteria bacterium]|nr:MAG: hypothetical protein DSY43_05325 [Gammaproteobacteria bacterium]
MTDEKEIALDTQILSLTVEELTDFALSLKIEKSKIENKSKVKVIREIRKQIEVDLESLDEEEQSGHLDGLIDSLKKIKDGKVDSEIGKLEDELKQIELKRKEIQGKLSQTKSMNTSQTPSTGSVIHSSNTASVLGGLSSTILHRDFKIQGMIGEPGQKDKLTYQSLISQIETGLEKSYSSKEIVIAVIRAVQPGLQLRSYLESVTDLTLERLRKFLRFHFHEKSATELYQHLTTLTQQPNEDPQSFLMKALTIRQKIVFASKESGSSITYDSSSVQSLFLHALETGLKDETIRAKIRPLTCKNDVSDEELIEAMFKAVSAETERSNKFNLPNKQKARVAAVESEPGTKEVLLAIKSLKAEFSAMQSEVKTLREAANQNQGQATAQKPTRHCDKCKTAEECRHCFVCGGLNHLARYCRSRNASGNERRLRPGDRE